MADDNEILVGFALLKDADREDLIKEIQQHGRRKLEALDDDSLRANVINLRVDEYRDRLGREAGLQHSMFGGWSKQETEE